MNPSEIKELRHKLHLTQEELAHTIGVTFSTVNRWEKGHAIPSRLAKKALLSLKTQLNSEITA